MSNKSTIAIAIAAGFLGGFVSQRLTPMVASAQSAPPEIRAGKFVLVDEAGVPKAALGIRSSDRLPTLERIVAGGRHAWAQFAGGPFAPQHDSVVPER
jgi:hypothetical protein